MSEIKKFVTITNPIISLCVVMVEFSLAIWMLYWMLGVALTYLLFKNFVEIEKSTNYINRLDLKFDITEIKLQFITQNVDVTHIVHLNSDGDLILILEINNCFNTTYLHKDKPITKELLTKLNVDRIELQILLASFTFVEAGNDTASAIDSLMKQRKQKPE